MSSRDGGRASSSQLAALFGDTFPSQLYSCLESVLGLEKATSILKSVFNRMKTKAYDPKNVLYNNCQPQHRKKMWSITQVMMEVQFKESIMVALQIKDKMQPLTDSWLKGASSFNSNHNQSTDTQGLSNAVNAILALFAETIEEHSSVMEIMTTVNELFISAPFDPSDTEFNNFPLKVQRILHIIMLQLKGLDQALGDKEATAVKWQIRGAITKGKDGEEEECLNKCLDATGFPQIPEDPIEGIFDMTFDPRILDPMTKHFSPAKVKYFLNAATKQMEDEIVFNPQDKEYANVYLHRRKDFLRINQVMVQVANLGKPMDSAMKVNEFLNFLLIDYSIPEPTKAILDKVERSILRPSFARLAELFAEKSENLLRCRNIWESMDDDLTSQAFRLEDKLWAAAPKGVRFEMYYLDIAFKAVKKWAGDKSAEHLKFQIKEVLLKETKKNKKEAKLAIKCLEILGYDKAKRQFADKEEINAGSKKDAVNVKLDEKSREKKIKTLMFDTHTFMIGVHLALLYDLKKEIRQAVVQKLNLNLSRSAYNSKAHHLAVVHECAKPQVWLSGMILNTVQQVAGKETRDKMEDEIRSPLLQYESQDSMAGLI